MTRPRPTPSFFTTSDGFRLAWYDLGGGAAGPAIVLQHGFSATTWSEWVECGIAEGLLGLGRRVVALDALGHGGSDHPHDPRHYGEARMANDISGLATHLGLERFDLVGYSMGAVISLLVATDEPRLRRLFVGGVGEGVVACGGVDRRAYDNEVVAAVLSAADPSAFPDWAIAMRRGVDARGNDREALAAHARVVHATPIALDRIGVPTLLVAGDSDPLAVRPEALAATIPDCRLAIVPGDHTGSRLSPEFLAALLDFLA